MVETLIVTALVIWSAIYTFKKVFPKSAYKVFNHLANICERQGWHKIANWIRPDMVAGCGGGCDCSSSPSKSKVKVPETVEAVKWK
ncbi:DUF6587 family protein [Acinetobacter pollinis]|uniref:DUF6587 family protein n=1 Tax=Acinetobacter pollinis TaxID=2605270 RepID=UPI0018A30210|nr:DUF6587 family protein [Acinetobacter pollinis]MBF7690020.1 hypothetical protein [Acinetobacter pollinis]MBF7692755.1 hypothetical protein [Acinetobacter pollinis]MBF7697776.1 hypothetical protein [Acinetobacter pollinis]MBF7700766.1 hypothetical protein [Acinetobacter pollinis]